MRLVNAAKAAGVQAIDSVFADVGDLEGLRAGARSRARWASRAWVRSSFADSGGPRAFAPTPAEIEKALKIVAAFEEAQAKGLGVVSLGSKMIDAPVVLRALKLIERAQAMGIAVPSEHRNRSARCQSRKDQVDCVTLPDAWCRTW